MRVKRIIKFGANWCQPCRVLSPIFHKVSNMDEFKNIDFYDLDIDDPDNAEVVENYQIRNVPTVLAVDDKNEVVRRIVGAVPEHQFISLLKDAINNG